ncbi:MAG: single-stranded-DNA-specific exonuclease RecJ [Ignavibacteriae bacterium]|nr:single-stranded-DNA-specific exonuclease RecJ [Ignavibacteriota bacterium]MCB9208174.1 single-stranded-DNA-specific exonuclease RecJ [Ignavibacteriales bacterium]MCB9258940.1 single-stranded-DNA-specific exonuclease RecJ [Ignavibacteriales bacterium]
MIKKKWTLKDPPDKNSVLALADSLNISTILAELLIQRGVTNFFEAKKYFRPSLDSIHDPYLMSDMEKAATRVIDAITNNEKICVYGDYDVDGTCSASLMYLFLKELGANAYVYIPNRLTEGYGLSLSGIDHVKNDNVDLIISVDCGITAVDEIDYANTFGIDTIICDHHQPKEQLPNAYAILDPLKPGCEYPFKYLSGAGVAFKLARAIADRFGNKEMVFKYLDLVALAGAADIVPLTDENRILVRAGIDQINTNPRPGIKALIKIARMEPGNLSAGQIVFTIAPRINAVGRLGDANRAVELFNTNSYDEAERLARVLESENLERRKIDEVTFSHALEMVKNNGNFDNELGIVLHHESWHPGVVGIVASRLVEKFYRPSIMLTTIDGVAKGSARSIPGFNIYEAIEECKDLIVQFGGHKAAAGLEIEVKNIEEFRIRFNEILKKNLKEDEILPEVKIDAKISLCEITPKFIRVLEQFAPFGPGNMRPIFLAENVKVIAPPRIVGTNHFVTTFCQNGGDKVYDAIGFNLGKFVYEVDKDTDLVDIVFTIEKVVREGRTYPQIRVKDIRVKELTQNKEI